MNPNHEVVRNSTFFMSFTSVFASYIVCMTFYLVLKEFFIIFFISDECLVVF